MSQVFSGDIECPYCKSKTLNRDFDVGSQEVNESCDSCGFYYSFEWDRNEDGTFKYKDSNLEINLRNNFDNSVGKVEENTSPFGYLAYTNTKNNTFNSFYLKEKQDLQKAIETFEDLLSRLGNDGDIRDFVIVFKQYNVSKKLLKTITDIKKIKKLLK